MKRVEKLVSQHVRLVKLIDHYQKGLERVDKQLRKTIRPSQGEVAIGKYLVKNSRWESRIVSYIKVVKGIARISPEFDKLIQKLIKRNTKTVVSRALRIKTQVESKKQYKKA